MGLFSVSVDLDALDCYYRIHALGPVPAATRHIVLERGVARFAACFAELGVAATFFVVGRDVDGADAGARRHVIRALAGAGHEVASHSYAHAYDLARHDAQATHADLARADQVLSDIIGRPIVGFRAPGYDVSPAMLASLVALGYRYDSSIFAAPGYYAAKAAVMGALAVLGRPSGAVLTNPRALWASADPYRPALTAPWRKGDASLVELPIAVTPGLRLPAIGTSLLLAPPRVRAWMVDQMARRPHFNFELHGIDLVDAALDEVPPALVARQPDLRRSWQAKRDALADVVTRARQVADVVPLAEAAAFFATRE